MDAAYDRLVMGLPSSIAPSEQEDLMTAYHEAGHALTSLLTTSTLSLYKVTIQARANSLGHTNYIPQSDFDVYTKKELESILDVMMGGRAAEELMFGTRNLGTGCGSDVSKATDVAKQMVKLQAMSKLNYN